MSSIDWQKSYEIFLKAAEQGVEDATKILLEHESIRSAHSQSCESSLSIL